MASPVTRSVPTWRVVSDCTGAARYHAGIDTVRGRKDRRSRHPHRLTHYGTQGHRALSGRRRSSEPHEMAACRLSAHDQAGSEEELDPKRLAVARRFPGTANGDRHITLTASTRTGEHGVRDAPGHWLSQHQCKGHAQNVQIRDSSRLDQPRTDERAERRF